MLHFCGGLHDLGLALADHVARTVRYQRFDGRSKDWVTINPPAEIMTALLARDGDWQLHPIAGIITTPTLRADGTILDHPGYDPETRLFLSLDRDFRMPAIPEHPSRADAELALAILSLVNHEKHRRLRRMRDDTACGDAASIKAAGWPRLEDVALV